MCIIADSVDDVSKTRIASFHVAYTLDNGATIVPSQLVVYSANVDSLAASNAFILPVYNPGNDYRKIIPLDMSNLPDFLDDVDKIYNRWFPKRQSYSMTNSLSIEYDSEPLPVHTVGEYQFSIMPSKSDFDRLDRNKLAVNPAAQASINVHSKDYSFIVYQFHQRGKLEITPFGYLCQPFKEDQMIIPTIHGHPHADIGFGSDYNTPYATFGSINRNTSFEDQADFDHEIYTMVKAKSSNVNNNDLADVTRLLDKIQQDYMKRQIHIFCPKMFVPRKIKINGDYKNRNLLVDKNGYQFYEDLIIKKTPSTSPSITSQHLLWHPKSHYHTYID